MKKFKYFTTETFYKIHINWIWIYFKNLSPLVTFIFSPKVINYLKTMKVLQLCVLLVIFVVDVIADGSTNDTSPSSKVQPKCRLDYT